MTSWPPGSRELAAWIVDVADARAGGAVLALVVAADAVDAGPGAAALAAIVAAGFRLVSYDEADDGPPGHRRRLVRALFTRPRAPSATPGEGTIDR